MRRLAPVADRRGFTLLEMTVALSLMVTLTFIATQLFHTDARMMADAEASQTRAARIDHLLAALRRDVWSSQRVSLSGDRTLTVERRGADAATWAAGADGGVKRVPSDGSGDEQSWPAAPPMTFALQGSTVIVRIGRGGAEEQIVLTPELQSLRGGAR